MPALPFAGHDFIAVDRTALHWPARSALIVADLHLEKASWFAARGQMLPPQDSMATLERLARVIAETDAREVWCLGDNFHDGEGPARMQQGARAFLSALTDRLDWRWITGNHDAALPPGIGGSIGDEAAVDGLMLRHRAVPGDPQPELSGHYHPKYRAQGARGGVTRPCFVISETKLILPAFGALTGGLHASHPEITGAAGRPAQAAIATSRTMLRFVL